MAPDAGSRGGQRRRTDDRQDASIHSEVFIGAAGEAFRTPAERELRTGFSGQ